MFTRDVAGQGAGMGKKRAPVERGLKSTTTISTSSERNRKGTAPERSIN